MKEKEFSIRDIFTGNYSIPIYQRAYAWSDKEIETLIDDIYDYSGMDQNYYIGSLVVHKDNADLENVIDGQQRLTTLSLLICYLKNESDYKNLVQDIHVNLNFESRQRSTDIFKHLKKNYEKVMDESNELVDGYKILKKKLKSEKYDEQYFRYLIDNVILIKNELPKDTDLNHYFEIMNNRGEQLEKHEIVKAYFLGLLDEFDNMGRQVIDEVWNACQQLDKYVQIGFKTNIREKIFGDKWDEFIPEDYFSMKKMFEEVNENGSAFLGFTTIDEIIKLGDSDKELDGKSDDDDTGRYHSIINFPNFLLHVLKLYKGDSFNWKNESKGISLDDKKLIEQFKTNINTTKDVEEFVFLLLKTRYIFDNYVIKTDHMNDATDDNSNWSLHKPHMLSSGKNNKKLSPRNTFYEDPNTQEIVVKIQSMFQVTDPRQIYKSFLYGILSILNNWLENTDEKQLVNQLINFAKERFNAVMDNREAYDKGVDTPNYIFNFLDFVLWYQQKFEGKNHGINANEFEFKYRNSVEHFYPQNPNQAENHERLADEYLNNFGNLCIMARRHNSLRSNLMPAAKIKEFSSTSQSLKFEVMEKLAKEKDDWNVDEINMHGTEMKTLLSAFISQ